MERKKVGLLLVAAAAYGAYRYSKLAKSRKNNLKTKDRKSEALNSPEIRQPAIANSAEYF